MISACTDICSWWSAALPYTLWHAYYIAKQTYKPLALNVTCSHLFSLCLTRLLQCLLGTLCGLINNNHWLTIGPTFLSRDYFRAGGITGEVTSLLSVILIQVKQVSFKPRLYKLSVKDFQVLLLQKASGRLLLLLLLLDLCSAISRMKHD